MKIDVHVHVWDHSTPLWPGRSYTPSAPAPAEALLEVMDSHHVQGAVLVQPQFLGTDNSYVLKAITKWPDRFRGVAVVGETTSADELADLKAAGIAGVRFNMAHGWQPNLQSESWQGLVDRIVKAELHIQLYGEAAQVVEFLPPLDALGARTVIDHFGKPSPETSGEDPAWLSILGSSRSSERFIKLSGPYRLSGVDLASLAPRLLDRLGAEHLVWGSDFPWTRHEEGQTYARCLKWAEDWVPDPEDRSLVLGLNAVQLYGFR